MVLVTRRRLSGTAATIAAVATVGATLSACGSADEPTPPPVELGPAVTVPASAPPSGPITDSTVLQAALLTAADLPPGYAPLPDPVDDLGLAPDTGDTTEHSRTDPTACANVLDTVARQVPGATASAEQNLAGPGFTSIDVDMAGYAGTGAADAFATVQSTLRGCTAYTGTDFDGTPVQYRLEPLQRSTVGDASTAFRLTTTSEGFTLVSDAIVAVVGSTVVQVAETGPDAADGDLLTRIAATTTDRIRAASQPG
ncbi:sensor domain-containing protein [Prescottella defluvii]